MSSRNSSSGGITPSLTPPSSSSTTTIVRPTELLTQLKTHKTLNDSKRLQTFQSLHRTLTSTISITADFLKLYPEIIRSLKWCLSSSSESDVMDHQTKFQTLKHCLHYVHIINTNDMDFLMREVLPLLTNVLQIIVEQSNNSRSVWLGKIGVIIVKCMVGIHVKEYVKELLKFIKDIILTGNSKLIKCCIYSIPRIYSIDRELILSSNVLSIIYDLLESDDLSITCLTVLNEMNEMAAPFDDIKLSFNYQQACWFVTILTEKKGPIDEFAKVQLLQGLMNYHPLSTDPPIFTTIISKISPLLTSQNSAIVINTFKLILYLLNSLQFSKTQLSEIIIPKLTESLSSQITSTKSSSEIRFLILRNVILLTISKPSLLNSLDIPSLFFCSYDDPSYIKDTKLEILYLVSTEKNIPSMILPELEMYAGDIDVGMARKAIRAIGNLAIKYPNVVIKCVEVLKNLIRDGGWYALQECVVVLKNIFRRYDFIDSEEEKDNNNNNLELKELLKQVLNLLIEKVDEIRDIEAKSSMIWIVGQYCLQIGIIKSETILFDLTEQFELDPVEVQLTSLTAVVKLQIQNSSSFVELTKNLLSKTVKTASNPDVRSRAVYYKRLLTSSKIPIQFVKDILNSSNLPLISVDSENEKLDPLILEELELNLGTLASIYLKPVGMVFRLTRRKILQKNNINKEKWWEVDLTDESDSNSENHRSGSINSNFKNNNNNNNTDSNNIFNSSETSLQYSGTFGREQDDDFRVSPKKKNSNNSNNKLGRKLSVVGRKFSLKR